MKNPVDICRKKLCKTCGKWKSLDMFYVKDGGARLQSECKKCNNQRGAKNYKKRMAATTVAEQRPMSTANPWENLGWNERPNWHDNKRYIPDAVPTHQYANIKI